MSKLLYVITIFSAIILWYFQEYHSTKFIDILKFVPLSTKFFRNVPFPDLTSQIKTPIKIFTPEELKQYNGDKSSLGLYIAILGDVYDVSKGQKHYGPGGAYHVFAGRDASRSFVTGDFESGNELDHVLDLSLGELLSLRDWSKFYKKEYPYVGKLSGRFYNHRGGRTEYWDNLQQKFNEAEKSKEVQKSDENLFPPCNVEWNAESGTKVWCSQKSGGISRSWIGVPRKLYMIGTESYRCACVDMNELRNTNSPQHARRGHLQQYDNCDPKQYFCFVKE